MALAGHAQCTRLHVKNDFERVISPDMALCGWRDVTSQEVI